MKADKDGEMYSGGYTGKVLRVDLTSKTFSEEPLPVETARDFIGGAGFTVKYLFDEVPADCDPLGPLNKLIFAPGPFTGTKIPCASRMAINAKSPLTGAMGVGLTGGHFPVEMKRAGYDVIIVEGVAEQPTWLWIKDGKVSFRSAEELWGMQSTRRPADDQGQAARPERAHLVHRSGRREALAPRLHRQRAPRRRPQGPRRRDGRQEPQGDRPARRAAAGDRRPREVQGGAQAHARRHEGQPGALLAVRARGHLRQRGELHGARHLPLEQLDDDRGREVRGHHRRRGDRHAGRRAHRLRRVPGGLQPDAPRAGGALLRHHDRGPRVRDALLVRRYDRRHGSGRHHRRRPRRRRVRSRHDVGRRDHRLRHGALRARHHHDSRTPAASTCASATTSRWSS